MWALRRVIRVNAHNVQPHGPAPIYGAAGRAPKIWSGNETSQASWWVIFRNSVRRTGGNGATVPNTVRVPGGKGDCKTGLILVWVVRLPSGGRALVIADPCPSSGGR